MAAIIAIAVIKKRGLKVPEDIAVVGFSNWQISALVDPTLTTVDQPGYEMGREAAHLFLAQVEADDEVPYSPKRKVLDAELIVRDSSVRRKPGLI